MAGTGLVLAELPLAQLLELQTVGWTLYDATRLATKKAYWILNGPKRKEIL